MSFLIHHNDEEREIIADLKLENSVFKKFWIYICYISLQSTCFN